jgi:hypothetical protein
MRHERRERQGLRRLTSRHLARLKAAGDPAIEKKFKCNYPMTVDSLTKNGREAFANYAEKLKCFPGAAESKSDSKD